MTQARLIVGAMVAAALLVAISPMVRAGFHAGCPASGPCATPSPTPTPIGANIVLDFAAGGPNTRITVNGSGFLANESMTLYWDVSSNVAGSATTDVGGNFTQTVKPFPGDGPGLHHLCVSVPPNPCAAFTLQGPPTPTPPAAPSPSPSSTPSESPSPSPSASPVALTVNNGRSGLDVITRPPFVFLPIIALLALLAALAYWVLMRGERTPVLPAASVVHRSARPDIGPVTPRPPPTPPVPPAAEMPTPSADLPPPPAPFDPTGDPDAPAGPSEPPEPSA
jgi:hypothetical protein